MKKGFSIRTTVVIFAIIFMSIMMAVNAFIGYRRYYKSVMNSYIAYTDTVLNYAATAAVKYKFGDMIAAREMPEDYEHLRSELNQIKEDSNIEYLYAIYFDDPDDMHSLYYAINTKTKAELAEGMSFSYMGTSGRNDGFADATLKAFLDAVKSGKKDNGFQKGYSQEYGFQLNGYRVVFDSAGNAAGLLCVEIDISTINDEISQYVSKVGLITIFLTLLMVLLYLMFMNRYLIRPIEQIGASTNTFMKKMRSNVDPAELRYDETAVESGSEIGLLADNVRNLANGVASYMVNLQTVTAERERLGSELALATQIQDSVLPNTFPAFPERTEIDIYAAMHPAREVGGDFYDFFLVDDDHLCMVMADVSGKGVPAALFMMSARIVLQSIAMMGKTPGQILTEANATLCINNTMKMFVTVWLGILELSTGKLTAANAGHEYPAIKRKDGRFEIYKDKHGFVLGGMEGMKYKEYELLMEAGDQFFIYTDGVPEATDAEHKMFGLDRMIDALNTDSDAGPEQILKNVRQSVDAFVKDAEQFDDLTMLCIEYKGTQATQTD
uniref:PP2C family protein-serine/threonine phosphatase n=1 Tax=Eubacterium cellulosolvens TaxID=29322 RepID=UPI000686335C|nr:PP2C family protein-serine/threonine phosphatase [[Eubacterium] cellulosolvens]